jgi:fructose-1,6-bisphosphatase/inositol monophosphatase family enzyme
MTLSSMEISCLEDFRTGRGPGTTNSSNPVECVRFGIWSLLEIGNMVRSRRISPADVEQTRKDDGSPVTVLEEEIEDFMKASLRRYLPGVEFMGEESGGEIPAQGISLALDPLDGTWSFLGHTETCAASLAFFRDRQPFLGMVMNPATGEIGYALEGKTTRLIQLSLFGEDDRAVNLPTRKPPEAHSCLVNFHPSKNGGELMQSLYRLWQEKKVKMVKSTGGSPAWALLEAAKGHYLYINLWSKRPAVSYDLAAAVLLVRGAGGDVINLAGTPVPFIGHQGVFIAGVSPNQYPKLLEALERFEIQE